MHNIKHYGNLIIILVLVFIKKPELHDHEYKNLHYEILAACEGQEEWVG